MLLTDGNNASDARASDARASGESAWRLLGYLGNTEAARQILNGTFICPLELDLETRLCIEGL